MKHYTDPIALRRSLETRLKARGERSGLPLDRLRKEAALQRLLARIAATAPEGSWALKGGLAMLARIGDRARVTADADATWRTAVVELVEMLEDAAEVDLGDHFEFLVGEGKPIQAEGTEGGLRFPVRCLLAGRPFETLRLDLNLVPSDPRPLAEKVHAYTRDYGEQDNSRAKDLYDMLAIAQHLKLPTLGQLRLACEQTFVLRNTTWPPATLQPPPELWTLAWRGFVRDYDMPFPSLEEAYGALHQFWQPVFDGGREQPRWYADTWAWR